LACAAERARALLADVGAPHKGAVGWYGLPISFRTISVPTSQN
jgi:hypothetical protein